MSHPVATTGLPMFLPALFPEGLFIYIAGCADDPTAGRGAGTPFILQSDNTAGETKQCNFSMSDWVYFAGGGISWQGAQVGDWASLRVVAPATQIAPNQTNQGSVDLAGNYLVPNLSQTGAYDIVNAIPIHAVDDDNNPLGQWVWSEPDTGFGTVTPGPPNAQGLPVGPYVMVPAAVPLAQFIARYQLTGSGMWNLNMPFIKPAKVLPHWQVQVSLHNSGHAGLALTWQIVTARAATV